MIDLPLGSLVIANLVAFAAAFVQANVGVGFAMIAVPVLLVVDPSLAPVPVLFAMVVLSLAMLVRERGALDRSDLRTLAPGLFIGTVLAAAAMPYLPHNTDAILGVLILGAVVWSLLGVPPRSGRAATLLAGAAAGAMGTASGVHGPALALAYRHHPPAQARATIAAVFVLASSIAIVARVWTGTTQLFDLVIGTALLPGTLGGLAATFMLPRPSAALARRAMLGIAAVSAVVLIARSV